MRKPFILAIYTDRPLTKLQCLRRGKLLEKTRYYRQYRNRMLRDARLHGKPYPRFRDGRLAIEPTAMLDSRMWEVDDDALAIPDGNPVEQWNLEIAASGRLRRMKDEEKR